MCPGTDRSFQAAKLNARFAQEGIEGTYFALLDVMKNVTVFLSDQQSLFNSAINGSKSSNLTYSVSYQLAPA